MNVAGRSVASAVAVALTACALIRATGSVADADSHASLTTRATTIPPVASIGSVSAAAATRLRAVGLDPAAADFQTALGARLKASRSRLHAASGPIVTHTLSQNLSLASSNAAFRPIGATIPAATPPPAGKGGSTIARLSNPALLGIQKLTWQNVVDPAERIVPEPWSMPSLFVAALDSSDTALPTGPAHLTVDVPACGVHAVADANFYRSDQGGAYQNLQPPVPYYATFFLLFGGPDPVPAMPLGAGSHDGTLTLSTAFASGSLPAKLTAGTFQSTYSANVAEDGTLASDGGLALSPADVSLANATVERVNTGSTPITGTDTLGSGVALGSGVTASAAVVSATSIADQGGDSSANNGYRGAVVTTQPQSNRLQTVVSWHIGPGDSLAYTVTWTFQAPYGQRVVNSLPLGGPCDS